MPTFVYVYVQYLAQMHVPVLAVIIVFASSCLYGTYNDSLFDVVIIRCCMLPFIL